MKMRLGRAWPGLVPGVLLGVAAGCSSWQNSHLGTRLQDTGSGSTAPAVASAPATGTDHVVPAGGGEQPAGAVEVKVVKYDGLKDVVNHFRGRVLVVDCWSLT